MVRDILVATCTLLLSGCADLSYYAQAVDGQLQVMRAERPIHDALRDPNVDPALKRKLQHVLAVRDFAIRELSLPAKSSYLTYADLGRPFALWDVFATSEFSVEPEKWCLHFVGCVNYRGYYRLEAARQFASEIGQSGFETYIGGVTAYSTLGFFSDPVLNTFLRYDDAQIAATVFHELAHQLLFVSDDTIFNESFATTVEHEGLRRWLTENTSPQLQAAFRLEEQRREQFERLVDIYRGKLNALYHSSKSRDEMRQSKAQILADMKLDYSRLRASWGGDPAYDKWFESGVNNAKIASSGLYTQLVPAFDAMLQQEGYDLPRFYKRVSELSRLPKDERLALLKRALPAARYVQPAASDSTRVSVLLDGD